ncbi:hypothetical protein RHSIM_Rhsim10G0061800 [Rhododendron simsii]|uniref:Uncharacterized protein n=1 Tax=Rhododendron simsii TaxID=118357 RepID=A0A834G972_RHOSS|nr:hypothetical protein RHSIM_Rhsim10G0061800 [Rhododendron simsii]
MVGKALLKLPLSCKKLQYLLGGKPHATAMRLSERGEILEVLEDREGKSLRFIREVEENKGKLWIGGTFYTKDLIFHFAMEITQACAPRWELQREPRIAQFFGAFSGMIKEDGSVVSWEKFLARHVLNQSPDKRLEIIRSHNLKGDTQGQDELIILHDAGCSEDRSPGLNKDYSSPCNNLSSNCIVQWLLILCLRFNPKK